MKTEPLSSKYWPLSEQAVCDKINRLTNMVIFLRIIMKFYVANLHKKFHICPFHGGDAIVCINIKDSFLYCDSGFIQCARLSDRIFSISSTLLSILSVPIISNVLAGISIRIKSSFSTKAIGPPSEASGDTCPIAGPRVAPEKRPSVINAMVSTNSGSERSLLSYKTFLAFHFLSVLHNG